MNLKQIVVAGALALSSLAGCQEAKEYTTLPRGREVSVRTANSWQGYVDINLDGKVDFYCERDLTREADGVTPLSCYGSGDFVKGLPAHSTLELGFDSYNGRTTSFINQGLMDKDMETRVNREYSALTGKN